MTKRYEAIIEKRVVVEVEDDETINDAEDSLYYGDANIIDETFESVMSIELMQ